jgi:type I restriction enzyme S subunit
MSKQWPTVKLGDVLRHRKEFITIDDLTNYKRPRVQLHVQGIVLRDEVPGALIKTKRQQVCRTGEFLVAEIDAKVGGFGIVPTLLDGSLVSSHYFLFVIDETKLDRRFLDFFIRTPAFREQVAAQGSTNYAAIRPAHVLRYELPLPPLAEQRRVVARIEELAEQIREARTLRNESAKEADALMAGAERRIWPASALKDAPNLESITRFLARGKQSEQGESHHYLIKTQHVQQGRYIPTLMRLAPHVALKVKSEAVVQDGDILIACSAAGCLGRVARYRGDGKTLSTDTHIAIARPNQDAVEPDYLYAYLCGAQGQHQLRSRERGDWQREKISFRLTELNLNDLRKVPVPVPALPEQRRIVAELGALKAEVDALKRLQAETAAELDAMLPSILDRAFREQLVVSDIPGSGKAITTIGVQARPTFSAEDYFLQFIPALLRAVGGRLELDKLNATVALLFLPKVLHPLIDSVGGADARAQFDRFNQPLKDSAFVPMLRVLMKTGAITCDANDQVTSLHLHESAAPPIEPVVEEDARFLAAIVNLIPPSPVQATVGKLCPQPAKEELLAMP